MGRDRHERSITLDEARAEIALRFPYDEALKDRVKQIPAARWAPEAKAWCVPADYASEVLEIIGGEGWAIAPEVTALAERGGHNARMRRLRRLSRRGSLTPATLNSQVEALLREGFPEDVWLIGEIADWKGNVWFSLVEHHEGESTPRARVQASLFERDRDRIRERLNAMNPPLRWSNGLEVRLRCRVEMHARSGAYRVRVYDIDPDYTLIQQNRRREEALRMLDEEGISEKNLDLPLPEVPLRVGLITAEGSDAARDFLDELRRSGLGFEVTLFPVRVQGVHLERTVLAALAWFAAREADFDCLVLTRGGGAQTDLAGFDLYSVGRAVALHPLPVLCGIGHQRDHSLVDDLARSYKTPTAVAGALVTQVKAFQEEFSVISRRVGELAEQRSAKARQELAIVGRGLQREGRHRVQSAEQALETVGKRLSQAASGHLRAQRSGLGEVEERLPGAAQRRLGRAGKEVSDLGQRLGPRRILQDLREQAEDLGRALARLDAATGRRFARERGSLATSLERLAERATRRVDREKAALPAEDRLGRPAARLLARERERLGALDALRAAADPARALERGYALVIGEDGRLARDPAAVPIGSALRIRLAKGELRAVAASAGGADQPPKKRAQKSKKGREEDDG